MLPDCADGQNWPPIEPSEEFRKYNAPHDLRNSERSVTWPMISLSGPGARSLPFYIITADLGRAG